MLCLASQQQPRQAAPTVRGHHDQVAPVLTCSSQDRLRHLVGVAQDPLGLDALLVGCGDDGIDRALTLTRPTVFDASDFFGREGDCALKVAQRVVGYDVQNDQVRTELCRQSDRTFFSLAREP